MCIPGENNVSRSLPVTLPNSNYSIELYIDIATSASLALFTCVLFVSFMQ